MQRVGYRITGGLLLLGMACAAIAQDFPALKGDQGRTGKSTSFLTSGPGAGLLTWYRPNFTDNVAKAATIDNLMKPTGADPAYVTTTGTWFGPGDMANAAGGAFIPTDFATPAAGVTYSVGVSDATNASPIVITTPTNHNLFTADNVRITAVLGNTAANADWVITVLSPTTFSLDGSTGNGVYSGGGNVEDRSDFQVAECIASEKNGDPNVPLNVTDTLSTFTWAIRNTVTPFYEAYNYAVYAHIPQGPTTVGGTQRFSQRYYVFEITYAGGSEIDVVDTDLVSGWFRLGGKGGPTNRVYPADGITPITVKLYNTVPRDADTDVLTTNAGPGDDLDLSQPRPVVYADAVRAIPEIGFYASTPIVSSIGLTTTTVGVLNERSLGFLGGSLVTVEKAKVESYEHNTGNRRWTFSPSVESALAPEMDNTSSGTTASGPNISAAEVTTANNYRGTGYREFTAMVNAPADSEFEFAPTLNAASYDIYVWIPGDSNGEVFAHGLQYEIEEGSLGTTTISVDQSGTTAKGWVKLGARGFRHSSSDPLKVTVTNASSDPTDVGSRKGYIDAVKFVGPGNLTVFSTPVQTTALITPEGGGAPVATPVTIVADENGVIYCLDADGRGDGTTDIIWTYPSTRDASVPLPAPGQPDTWKDPNLNAPTVSNPDWAAIDGTNNQRIAQMPTGFGMSSPVIFNIGGADYLFIGGRTGDNRGRVYCIEMAGRGDGSAATRKPGTTRRVWSYPDDFPGTPTTSTLGRILGSVAVATNAAGPTVFVPTEQGRMYALDAAGNIATRTTTPRWTQPAMTDPTFGPMNMTPAVDFNQVFIGTESKDGSTPGQFMALNWDTGAINWTMAAGTRPLSGFAGGPATVDAVSLGGGMSDTVFVSIQNRGLFALDAGTGAIQWETYEPDAAVNAPLTFTIMNVFDTSNVLAPAPVIVAPQSNGKITLFNAHTSNINLAGGRFAGGYITQSQNLLASASVGWNFMYFADTAGYLYAVSNTAGGFPPGTVPPITPIASPNNPEVADYLQAGVKLVTKAAYQQLRQGTMYYADAIDPANALNRTPMAFEWGETLYMLIYNFPYQKTGLATPPVININITVGGESVRNVFTEARQFPDITDPNQTNSGYGIITFPLPSAGANALAPGEGQLSIGFNTTDASGSPINLPSARTQPVYVANPLALIVPGYGPSAPAQTIGNTNVTSDPENLLNGNPLNKLGILGSEGTLAHGQSGSLDLSIIDRSLITLLRGPGRGLEHVRVERNELQWQISLVPGEGAVLNPIDSILFPGFEDQPLNYPNTSLDYPDIYANAIDVTKSVSGNTENPIQYGVSLTGPLASDGSPVNETNAGTRALQNTPFTFTLNVPRYQPANEKLGNDLNNPAPGTPDVPAGYSGLFYVYVDAAGDGHLDRSNNFIQTDSQMPAAHREAFRSFYIASSVSIDKKFAVLTPTVDLGSLAEAVGYTPDMPGPANALFDPWTTQYSQLFKPFIIANEGNTNLLNLRLAKATTTDNSIFEPWPIFSPSNEDFAYLDGSVDLWSDLDPAFAPMRDIHADGVVIGQKSRVGDRSSRQVTTNPFARPNYNTGIVIDTPRLPSATYPVQAPRVAVTLPFGFPVGTYIGLLKVIDDDSAGSSAATMWQNLDPTTEIPSEPNSDPGLRITFRSREARVTSTFSTLDAPFIDDLVGGTDNFRYGNLQPTGFRNPTGGSLVVAMASARTNWTAVPAATVTDPQWRIYLASVQGTDPQTATGNSRLRDLHGFVPDTANNRWFQQSPVTSAGFPDQSLDVSIWGGNLVAGTAKYGSPVFPAEGMLDPFRGIGSGMGAPFPNALMAFVGNARIDLDGDLTNTVSDRATQSKIFVAPITVDGAGAVGVGDIYAMTNDPTAVKGRPSILQTQNGFVLFYAATVGGRSNIYYVLPSGTPGANQYDGSYFTESIALDLGEGFESVSSPHVSGRRSRGGQVPIGNNGSSVIELTFAGKLHGRPVSEIFYGEIGTDNLEPTDLLPMSVRTRETLFESGQPGTFLVNGVQWEITSPITLEVFRAGTYTDIEVAGTRQTERGTGIITFDTSLGGKAHLDPKMGTVRLSGARPPRDSSLLLTYQPKLLRISEGTTAGYVQPSMSLDERFIPDITYWYRAGDGSQVDADDPVRVGRYLFTYGRAAAGAGQAARPILKSMRLGVDLPYPVFTDADGSTGPISMSLVNGTDQPLQYYQVDPAKRKIYFTQDDANKAVTITYEAADPGTGASIGNQTITASIDMIVERPEELMQLDQATDETNLFMFLDPFDYVNFRRPGLVWMLWSSTRAGAPDVYMQTIAPRFTPLITGK